MKDGERIIITFQQMEGEWLAILTDDSVGVGEMPLSEMAGRTPDDAVRALIDRVTFNEEHRMEDGGED